MSGFQITVTPAAVAIPGTVPVTRISEPESLEPQVCRPSGSTRIISKVAPLISDHDGSDSDPSPSPYITISKQLSIS